MSRNPLDDQLAEDEAGSFTRPLTPCEAPSRRAMPSFDNRDDLLAHVLTGGTVPDRFDFDGLPVRRVRTLPAAREGEAWLTGLDPEPRRSAPPTLRRRP